MSLQILDPTLGGKIRAVITMCFGILVFVEETFGWADQSWAGLAAKVYAVAVFVIQALTHFTDVGNAP